MRSFYIGVITILISVIGLQCGWAEVYSYRDENGVMVFSDTPPEDAQVSGEKVTVQETIVSPQGQQGGSVGAGGNLDLSRFERSRKFRSTQNSCSSGQALTQQYYQGLIRMSAEGRKLKKQKSSLKNQICGLKGKRCSAKRQSDRDRIQNRIEEKQAQISQLDDRIQRHQQKVQAYQKRYGQ